LTYCLLLNKLPNNFKFKWGGGALDCVSERIKKDEEKSWMDQDKDEG
jgi:hypothetical protein